MKHLFPLTVFVLLFTGVIFAMVATMAEPPAEAAAEVLHGAVQEVETRDNRLFPGVAPCGYGVVVGLPPPTCQQFVNAFGPLRCGSALNVAYVGERFNTTSACPAACIGNQKFGWFGALSGGSRYAVACLTPFKV